MVICPICGKEIDMFDMYSVSCSDKRNKSSVLVELCGSCFRMCTNAEKGDEGAVEKLRILREGMTDENAIRYVDGILNTEYEGNGIEFYEDEDEYLYVKATTGENFENLTITDYKDIVSGESIMETSFVSGFADAPGLTGVVLSEKTQKAKKEALDIMKKSCVEKGGNAVIGVTFRYVNLAENIMAVMASGTAVVAE